MTAQTHTLASIRDAGGKIIGRGVRYLGGLGGAPGRFVVVGLSADRLMIRGYRQPRWEQDIPFASVTRVSLGSGQRHASGKRVLLMGIFAPLFKVEDTELRHLVSGVAGSGPQSPPWRSLVHVLETERRLCTT